MKCVSAHFKILNFLITPKFNDFTRRRKRNKTMSILITILNGLF